MTLPLWRVRVNQLVMDTYLLQDCFKKRWFVLGSGKPVGEFKSVVGLNTFHLNDFSGEFMHDLFEKVCGGIGTLLRISDQDTVTGMLVNSGVLVQLKGRIDCTSSWRPPSCHSACALWDASSARKAWKGISLFFFSAVSFLPASSLGTGFSHIRCSLFSVVSTTVR